MNGNGFAFGKLRDRLTKSPICLEQCGETGWRVQAGISMMTWVPQITLALSSILNQKLWACLYSASGLGPKHQECPPRT